MAMTKRDVARAATGDIAAFAQEMRRLARPGSERGRLIFAMDATASREPVWAQACDVQAGMFLETERLGGLDVQLVYYRGPAECRASRWVSSPAELVGLMRRVGCRAGRTQIARVLRHALTETGRTRVQALVFVGDACEEPIDELGDLAGRLGLSGVRAFFFHEGGDRESERAFGHLAVLTGGAVCRFDQQSAAQLRALLSAVAVYAAGGRGALEDYARKAPAQARLITSQLG
jgi:hypothetical protein